MDREQLGLTETDGLRVEVADARVGLEEEAPGGRDLVVGDAFGGLSVPWQLTTVEAMGLVDRALTDDGVYVANLIDLPPLGFVRAELATLQAVFPHVALLARDAVLTGRRAATSSSWPRSGRCRSTRWAPRCASGTSTGGWPPARSSRRSSGTPRCSPTTTRRSTSCSPPTPPPSLSGGPSAGSRRELGSGGGGGGPSLTRGDAAGACPPRSPAPPPPSEPPPPHSPPPPS